jgi:hypothetical protein
MAVSADIRKGVKDANTGRKVATNLFEAQEDIYLEALFDEMRHESASLDFSKYESAAAAHSLPLRVLHLSFGPGIEAECILDGGSQVIVMRRDVWQQLNIPFSPAKALTMESANAESNTTLGLVENVPVQIGPVTVLLQIQIVDRAPFEVLLGRPFFDVTNCTEFSTSGGHHEVQIKDPKTNEPFVFATLPLPRKNPVALEEQPENFQG